MKLSIVQTSAQTTFAASTPRRSGWTSTHRVWLQCAMAAALMAAAVFVTFDAWRDIVGTAVTDQEQSHALLVPVVAAWLFWVRRERLRGYVPQATWAGPLMVAAGWALNRLGDRYLLFSLWHVGALLVVVGALVTVAGGGFLTRLLPVFFVLCFLIPVPGRIRRGIAIPLEHETANATKSVLETLGVPVGLSGNVLRINDQEVTIAEACNGLRMVFALVMVSFAFAYGVPLRNGIRVLVVLVSPLTAIFFNVVRLVPTVWAYGALSPTAAATLHDLGGWLMLPLAFLTLLGLMRLLRWAQIPISPYILAYGS